MTVGWQNLILTGINGSVPLGSTFRIRPSLDFRYQAREQEDGEGFLAGGGFDIPLRLFGGTDATEAFIEVPHSRPAMRFMRTLLVPGLQLEPVREVSPRISPAAPKGASTRLERLKAFLLGPAS